MAFSSAKRALSLSSILLITTPSILLAAGFDISRSDNLVAYYGQNSYGATHGSSVYSQQSLSTYCQDDALDVIPLAFLHIFFSSGGLPEIDLANTCNSNNGNVFPGTKLAVCHQLTDDIKTCQKRGKLVTMSLGGATGSTAFSSDAQARTFAETIWNLFLGGSSDTRPFGDAVLDGVDLDLESGSGTGMAAFVTRLRELSNGASKRYYVTAAPQCPFPDAYVGSAISAVGFDAIYVQFYNNYCGINNYHDSNSWNFDVWDNWAKNTSPNKNIKIYIGAPAAESAASTGYVSAETLGKIAQETRSKYSSFGGIMLWDISQAYGNNRYDVAVKKALAGEPIKTTSTTTKEISTTKTTPTTTKNTPTTTSTTPKTTMATPTTTSTTPKTTMATPTTTSTTPKTSPTATPTSPPGTCDGIANWDASTIYIHNNVVAHNGHKWTAGWWSIGDLPGGIVGVWEDNGPCSPSAKFRRLPRVLKH